MQATKDCSSPTPSTPTSSAARSQRLPNAFSDSFLVRARSLETSPSAPSPWLAGPWEVEAVAVGSRRFHAVVRRDEPVAEGGVPFAVLVDRGSALLTAAAVPVLGSPNHLNLGQHRKRLGVPLHDGAVFLGHLARPEPELLPLLHAVRSLKTQPEALALLLESLGPEGLAQVGRGLARRVA